MSGEVAVRDALSYRRPTIALLEVGGCLSSKYNDDNISYGWLCSSVRERDALVKVPSIVPALPLLSLVVALAWWVGTHLRYGRPTGHA